MKLIVNADDFGIDIDRDLGIAYGVLCGYISSVSVVVTNKITRLQRYLICLIQKRASVGIHINLTDAPLLTCSPEQLYSTPYTYSRPKYTFWRNSIEGTINFNLIVKEVDTQVHKFIKTFGFFPDHIDGHNHCNIFNSSVASLFEQISKKNNVHLRIPNEKLDAFRVERVAMPSFFNEYVYVTGCDKQAIHSNFEYFFKYDMLLYEILCKENCEQDPIPFVGTTLGYIRTPEASIDALREYQNEGVVQMMVHPGLYFPWLKHKTNFSSKERFDELWCLRALAKHAKREGIMYVAYTDEEITQMRMKQ